MSTRRRGEASPRDDGSRARVLPRVSPSAALAAWVGAAVVLDVLERAVAVAHGVAVAPSSLAGHAALLGLQLVLAGLAIVLMGFLRAAARIRPWVARVSATALGAAMGAALGGELAIAPSVIGHPGKVAVAWIGATAIGAAGAYVAASLGWRAGGRITLVLLAVAGLAVRVDATYAVGELAWVHDAAWTVVVVAVTLAALRVSAERRVVFSRAAMAIIVSVTGLATVAWIAAGPHVRAEVFLSSSLAREVLRAQTPAPPPPAPRTIHGSGTSPGPALGEPLLAEACVLLVTVDALRADALAPVRATDAAHARPGDTPALDAFVGESVAFHHAYATASYTTASLRALLSSQPPWMRADPSATLPGVLGSSGRTTIAVLDDLLVRLDEGVVPTQALTELRTHPTRDMGRAVDDLLAQIDAAPPGPWFGWMHVLGTHAPGFAGTRLDPDLPHVERYRRSVAWLDGELGRLLEGLRARGLDERTIVIVTADHGEALGEHGIATHGATVFEAEVRVPLVMRIPGVAPAQVDASVSLLDVMPTILDLVGAPPHVSLAGHSLLSLLRDPGATWPHDVVTMSRRDGYAIVRGRDKLVFEAGAGVSLLFDLARDPAETIDLAPERPALAAELSEALRERVWKAPP